jgi:hypothetical protein
VELYLHSPIHLHGVVCSKHRIRLSKEQSQLYIYTFLIDIFLWGMEAAHAHSEVRVSVPLPYTCKLIVQWLYGIVYIGCGLVRAMMRERISSVLDSNWRR